MDTIHLSFPEDGLLSLDSDEEKKVVRALKQSTVYIQPMMYHPYARGQAIKRLVTHVTLVMDGDPLPSRWFFAGGLSVANNNIIFINHNPDTMLSRLETPNFGCASSCDCWKNSWEGSLEPQALNSRP